MRAVVQRVLEASVYVENKRVSTVKQGLLVYLGVMNGDTDTDLDYIVRKVLNLRIFPDDQGKMNRSVKECGYEILVVSQFTICGSVIRGNRPSFDPAAPPEIAIDLYHQFCNLLRQSGLKVGEGVFQADMKVRSENNGPVTILIDSGKLF